MRDDSWTAAYSRRILFSARATTTTRSWGSTRGVTRIIRNRSGDALVSPSVYNGIVANIRALPRGFSIRRNCQSPFTGEQRAKGVPPGWHEKPRGEKEMEQRGSANFGFRSEPLDSVSSGQQYPLGSYWILPAYSRYGRSIGRTHVCTHAVSEKIIRKWISTIHLASQTAEQWLFTRALCLRMALTGLVSSR